MNQSVLECQVFVAVAQFHEYIYRFQKSEFLEICGSMSFTIILPSQKTNTSPLKSYKCVEATLCNLCLFGAFLRIRSHGMNITMKNHYFGEYFWVTFSNHQTSISKVRMGEHFAPQQPYTSTTHPKTGWGHFTRVGCELTQGIVISRSFGSVILVKLPHSRISSGSSVR